MKKDIWRWAERIVLLGAITAMLVNNVSLRTTLKNTVEQIKANDEKQDQYISNQNEINGKFLILYDYFINGSSGSREEE